MAAGQEERKETSDLTALELYAAAKKNFFHLMSAKRR